MMADGSRRRATARRFLARIGTRRARGDLSGQAVRARHGLEEPLPVGAWRLEVRFLLRLRFLHRQNSKETPVSSLHLQTLETPAAAAAPARCYGKFGKTLCQLISGTCLSYHSSME